MTGMEWKEWYQTHEENSYNMCLIPFHILHSSHYYEPSSSQQPPLIAKYKQYSSSTCSPCCLYLLKPFQKCLGDIPGPGQCGSSFMAWDLNGIVWLTLDWWISKSFHCRVDGFDCTQHGNYTTIDTGRHFSEVKEKMFDPHSFFGLNYLKCRSVEDFK